jgi:alginate O-acetyltransferase complex protein AlgI
MLFNSPLFLFLFLPLVMSIYYLAGKNLRNTVALSASIMFYAWGEPHFVFVALLSAFFDWHLGNWISGSRGLAAKKAFVALSVIQNIGILIYFKYTNFFIDNLDKLLVSSQMEPFSLAQIALPIGVSFIVFEKITYTVDIFRGIGHPSPKFREYLLYVMLFPKLLAGPIIKYHDIEDQLRNRVHSLDDITAGLSRFSLGLAKKVLIADTMGEVVDMVFGLPASDLNFQTAWIGIIFFAIQIYFDFSGYSDMAIGLARIMGFRILENFNLPYISRNFTEFWRRWHISLSTWIRDYLYIPLGGSRVPAWRIYFNLWVCFLLSGLWHGASWTFIFWGCYQGVFLAADRLFWINLQKRLPVVFNIGITFFFTLIGWVLFRSGSFEQMSFYLGAMFQPAFGEGFSVHIGLHVYFFAAIGLIFSFFPATGLFGRIVEKYESLNIHRELTMSGALVLCWLAIAKVSMTVFNPFLYFRF